MISFSSNSLFSVQVSFYFVRFVISWLCSILFELSFHFVRTVILFCLNCHFILFKLSFYFVQTVIFCSVLLLDTSLAGPHFGNDSTGTCCQVHKCVLQIAPPPPPPISCLYLHVWWSTCNYHWFFQPATSADIAICTVVVVYIYTNAK